jgi:hypothetical protein
VVGQQGERRAEVGDEAGMILGLAVVVYLLAPRVLLAEEQDVTPGAWRSQASCSISAAAQSPESCC